jgi:hypothetical protein
MKMRRKANIFFMDAKAIRSAPFTHTRVHTTAQPPRPPARKKGGVTDGTRTRNNQNHNLELYH